MNLKNIIKQAQAGRPDLAASNLGASAGDGMLRHPAKFLVVVAKFPHSSGDFIPLTHLAQFFWQGADYAAQAD